MQAAGLLSPEQHSAAQRAAALRSQELGVLGAVRRLARPHPTPFPGHAVLQAVLPIVKAYPQIETCMECSARKLQFVGEVFYYALKAGG
jgi:hypothetical protein